MIEPGLVAFAATARYGERRVERTSDAGSEDGGDPDRRPNGRIEAGGGGGP